MIFTRRHEQELAEIHALTYELDQRVQEGLEQLERIRETQDRLAGRNSTPTARSTGTAAPPPEGRSVELTSQRPKRRSGAREKLRQLIYGPEIELAPIAAEAGTAERIGEVPEDQAQAGPAVVSNGADPLLAFVHIPKTAGGTVMSMFVAAYSRAAVRDAGNYFRNPEKTALKVEQGKSVKPRKTGGRVSAGHVPYGVFREHLPTDTRYMTFLREPVDRVLSQYWRHIRRQDPSRAGVAKKKRVGARVKAESLEEALVEMRLPQINNLATRLLCGDPSPVRELPASAVEDAKANLREFAFVGIQERFEESLVLLQRMLGLGFVPYEDRHVSSDRPSVEEISDAQRALVIEYNRLDAELYTFGLSLFEDAVAGADDGFAADVEALRARDAATREEEWREAAFDS